MTRCVDSPTRIRSAKMHNPIVRNEMRNALDLATDVLKEMQKQTSKNSAAFCEEAIDALDWLRTTLGLETRGPEAK